MCIVWCVGCGVVGCGVYRVVCGFVVQLVAVCIVWCVLMLSRGGFPMLFAVVGVRGWSCAGQDGPSRLDTEPPATHHQGHWQGKWTRQCCALYAMLLGV